MRLAQKKKEEREEKIFDWAMRIIVGIAVVVFFSFILLIMFGDVESPTKTVKIFTSTSSEQLQEDVNTFLNHTDEDCLGDIKYSADGQSVLIEYYTGAGCE